MWAPFTERARRVIVLAQEEAQRLHCNYIGAEHILLGIMSEGENAAARVLENMSVSLAKTRAEVKSVAGTGGHTRPPQVMTFTPEAKRVIEVAFEEGRQLNHNYIGAEHLFLGLLRQREGVAAQVLTNLGVYASKARVELAALRESDPEPEPAPQPREGEVYQVSQKSRQFSFDESLTPGSRHALIAATEVAQRYGSPVCTVSHLLYGIAHVEASKASRVLAERGVTAGVIDQRLRAAQPVAPIDHDEIGLSTTARINVAQAAIAAQSSGRRKANPEHLLLAIAAIATGRESDGSRLLQTLGVDLEELTQVLENYLKGDDEHDAR